MKHLFRRDDIVVRITDASTGAVLQEIHCAPVPLWTRLAFEARWAIAGALRGLRRVFAGRVTR